MSPRFEVRYLAIEWQEQHVIRRLEAAPAPLDLEPGEDGGFIAESTIFKDRYAWVGIRLAGQESAGAPPALLTGAGRRPLLAITDPAGKHDWWILSDGWEPAKKRHLSELRRSAGDYIFQIGSDRLRLRNFLSEDIGADIQAYVDDFTGNLLWMIINDAAGATAGAGAGRGEPLLKALEGLCEATTRIVASPAKSVREAVDDVPLRRLHATAATFRGYAVRPDARMLPGRVFQESFDTPENRYLRHMLGLLRDWLDAWLAGASSRTRLLATLGASEANRACEARELTRRRVDPAVFDAQTDEIAKRLAALQAWRGEHPKRDERSGRFDVVLERPYGYGSAYFYKRADAAQGANSDGIAYRVIALPEPVRDLVRAVLHVSRRFTFLASATSTDKEDRKQKVSRHLELTSVQRIEVENAVLAERAERRRRLEAQDWWVEISAVERRELAREAQVAQRRATQALEKQRELEASLEVLGRVRYQLHALDQALVARGVARSGLFPFGMLYVSNPGYSACLRFFKQAEALLRAEGLDPRLVEGLQRVGILHASDIYEKWCLLKVCSVLLEDFLFSGEPGWHERLISAVVSGERNAQFRFTRSDLGMVAVVRYQQETKLGYRPDIVLTIRSDRGRSGRADLVLDAKYRTAWDRGGPAQLLDELVHIKSYDQAEPGASVFILQPCRRTVNPPASPLGWGRDCDYGAADGHNRGWITLAARASGLGVTEHLKRLVGMALQRVLLAPGGEEDGDQCASSFCIGCGAAHVAVNIRSYSTKGGGVSWTFKCDECLASTVRTHCYNCSHTLFKNGTQWTYHESLADQVTNIICPECGSYFDAVSSKLDATSPRF